MRLDVYLLDTQHIAILQRQTEPDFTNLTRRMDQLDARLFYLSIASFHEQAVGWHAYINRHTKEKDIVRGYSGFATLLSMYSAYTVLPFDERAAGRYQQIRGIVKRVKTMDLRIAAIALSRGFTVLTANIVDFGKVPELTVEDWTCP